MLHGSICTTSIKQGVGAKGEKHLVQSWGKKRVAKHRVNRTSLFTRDVRITLTDRAARENPSLWNIVREKNIGGDLTSVDSLISVVGGDIWWNESLLSSRVRKKIQHRYFYSQPNLQYKKRNPTQTRREFQPKEQRQFLFNGKKNMWMYSKKNYIWRSSTDVTDSLLASRPWSSQRNGLEPFPILSKQM